MSDDDPMPSQIPQRTARLVLVRPDGTIVGSLPPIPVATPWWQDIDPVVAMAREMFGIGVTVLRLLETQGQQYPGGAVTYLAEFNGVAPAALLPADGCDAYLAPHPLRLPYAEIGGPQADLVWARAALDKADIAITGPPEQIRTWNLSSIWRIPVAGSRVWLKAVPPFFAHEGRVLAALAGHPVPKLIARSNGRVLLAETPGEDLYEATGSQLLRMVTILVAIQAEWAPRVAELDAMGLPDWRGPALGDAVADVCERNADALPPEDRDILTQFAGGLPLRFAGVDACGIGPSLVHGDFHPGNARGDGDAVVLLDWGDCGIGHPLLDRAAFFERLSSKAREAVAAHWNARMRAAWPGSDPERAAALLAPVAAARQAVIYQTFIDAIEPAERVYHRHDPANWLGRTAALLRSG